VIYLYKILPLLTAPLFIGGALVTFGIIQKKTRLSAFGILILTIFSSPFFADWVIKMAEHPYRPIDINSLKKSDFVVVLSGDVKRFEAAVEILKNGKADKIIVTSGKTPWEKKELSDGQFYMSIAQEYGIELSKIIITNNVQNTEQEAKEISQLIPAEATLTLVTSATHMTRVMMLFKNYRFGLTAYPIKFFEGHKISPMKFIPSSRALHRSSEIYRELQGRLFYLAKHMLD
jgi:uncharacterized SAM-binding protein YcdF (DUF218 family)